MDLETPDIELEDLIIKEYEDKLFGEQHQVIRKENGSKLYLFFRLRRIYLLKLLDKCNGHYSYIVRKSSDEKVLMKRWGVKIEYSPN